MRRLIKRRYSIPRGTGGFGARRHTSPAETFYVVTTTGDVLTTTTGDALIHG